VLSPGQLEKDLVYIKNKGYTTINMTDLINYVYQQAPLPDKPIILTFDDGYESSYVYAFPLLQKYNMKGVLSVTGCYSEVYSIQEDHNISYSYLSWNQIKYLHDTEVFEIQNHSFDLHSIDCGRKGCMIKRGEDVASYQKFLKNDLLHLQEKLKEVTGVYPNTFTYPFGLISNESRPVVKELGFLASLSCECRINRITSDPECLYLLGRFNRPYGKSSQEFFKKILT
jgi:peptidoglycan/xylan/chitin deacetylase (PgdA/CDA1 family)